MPAEAKTDRFAKPTAAFVWGLALVVVCTVVWCKPASTCVFSIYAYAGRGWVEGRDVYALPPNAPVVDNFRYSPLVASFFAVLNPLPERVGGILWRLLGAGLVIGGFGYACRTLDPTWAMKTDRQRQWLWLLLLPLSVANLNNGQANLHVVGLLLLGVAAVGDSRWNLAAATLTIACLIKVYPVALVMLLVVLYPRPLGWRLTLATAIGLGAPFLTQSTPFVLDEYRTWFHVMFADDRFAVNGGVTSYRDLSLLLQNAGVPIDRRGFFVLQVATGVAAALACLVAKWRSAHASNSRRLALLAYSLGNFWMLLCGPCTESSTYILLAPLAAWLVVDAVRGEYSTPAKWLILCGAATVHAALFSSIFPFFRTVHQAGVHPLGTVILFAGWVVAQLEAKAITSASGTVEEEGLLRRSA